MGDRAVITTRSREVSVYLHWYGDPVSVSAFLAAAGAHGAPPPGRHGENLALLASVAANFFSPGGLSVGVEAYTTDDLMDQGDNGIYVVSDDSWEIEGWSEGLWLEGERPDPHDTSLAGAAMADAEAPALPEVSATRCAIAGPDGPELEVLRGGSPREVEVALEYCALQGYRSPAADPWYGLARLCQVLTNAHGRGTVLLRPQGWAERNGLALTRVGSFPSPRESDLFELAAIDGTMPEHARLGDDYVFARRLAPEDVAIGDAIYLRDVSHERLPHVVQAIDRNGMPVVAFEEYWVDSHLYETWPGMPAQWSNPNSHCEEDVYLSPREPGEELERLGAEYRALAESVSTEAAASFLAAAPTDEIALRDGVVSVMDPEKGGIVLEIPTDSPRGLPWELAQAAGSLRERAMSLGEELGGAPLAQVAEELDAMAGHVEEALACAWDARLRLGASRGRARKGGSR